MDLTERANSRIYWQYRNAPKMRDWLHTLPDLAQTELEDPAQIVVDLLDFENRTGDQIDIVGRIVGLDRPPIVTALEQEYTSFSPESFAPQMGEEGEQFGPAERLVAEETVDSLYRLLIKARIEINNGDATANNIVRSIRAITGIEDVRVNDHQDMTFDVTVNGAIDAEARFAIKNFDVFPRPQGVRFLGIIESAELVRFGVDFARMGNDPARFNRVYV